MKRLPQGTKIITENRLIKVWRLPNGNYIAQGKRQNKANASLLTLAERRHYVKELGSSTHMVKFLMETRKISLAEAWELLKATRGRHTIS